MRRSLEQGPPTEEEAKTVVRCLDGFAWTRERASCLDVSIAKSSELVEECLEGRPAVRRAFALSTLTEGQLFLLFPQRCSCKPPYTDHRKLVLNLRRAWRSLHHTLRDVNSTSPHDSGYSPHEALISLPVRTLIRLGAVVRPLPDATRRAQLAELAALGFGRITH